MKSTGKIVIVDLDGTLFNGNTLHTYFKCAIRAMLKHRRVLNLAQAMVIMTARRLRLISHTRMKYSMLSLCHYDDASNQDFADRLRRGISTKVCDILTGYANSGHNILLATAAPDTYTYLMHEVAPVPLTDILSSRYGKGPDLLPRKETFELRGIAKADAVRHYCTQNNHTISAIITDHADDLPLIDLGLQHHASIYLVGHKAPQISGAIYL